MNPNGYTTTTGWGGTQTSVMTVGLANHTEVHPTSRWNEPNGYTAAAVEEYSARLLQGSPYPPLWL